MRRAIYMALFFLMVVSDSCEPSNKISYSYMSSNYGIENGDKKDLGITSRLISYNDYLFEFKVKKNTIDTTFMESNRVVTRIYYDTLGVYLLSHRNKLYFEFDTFSLNHKIVRVGNITDKAFGQKFVYLKDTISDFYRGKVPKDTTIYGQHYFHIDSMLKNKDGQDSILSKMLLFKNPNFMSVYKMEGNNFADKEYSVVGYHIHYYANNIDVFGIVEGLRPLDKEEEKICALMIKKSLNSNIDTIKNNKVANPVF
jgi:hypothetical protein